MKAISAEDDPLIPGVFLLLPISFLFYQFVITTSMDTDKGLARRLPPPVPKDQKKNDVDVNKRNLVVVLINSSNQILFNGEPTDIKQLKDKVKEFIDNPYNDANKPEKVEEDVPFFGKVMTAKKHVISLQNDRGTEYQAYISVQNELAKAYNELRDDISRKKFGKLFADLDECNQRFLFQLLKFSSLWSAELHHQCYFTHGCYHHDEEQECEHQVR